MSRAAFSVITPAPRAVWQELVRADPTAVVSQSPQWTAALCASGRYRDASRLYEFADGRLALLPMVARPGCPPGWGVEASLPAAWGMGGLIAPGAARPQDIAAVVDDLAGRRLLRTSLRPSPLQGAAWAASRPRDAIVVPRCAHVLDLSGGFDHVWHRRFAGTARTAVRKAERSGVSVESDDAGRLIPAFYELFERSLRRWAAQQHEPAWLAAWRGRLRDPRRKLELIARELRGAMRIWLARVEGRPAAAILVLQDGNAHYTRGAMDKALAGPARANYLLHSLAIETACQAGCRSYHMGESGDSGSLAQFKTRFGAEPYRYEELHLERLPLTALDRTVRGGVKRAIGFRD